MTTGLRAAAEAWARAEDQMAVALRDLYPERRASYGAAVDAQAAAAIALRAALDRWEALG